MGVDNRLIGVVGEARAIWIRGVAMGVEWKKDRMLSCELGSFF